MTVAALGRLGAALMLALGLVACTADESPVPEPAGTEFPNWPDSLQDLRFRWTAEPGIDLLTGPAVPLRAYLESHRIGDMTGNAEDAYPGFTRAVPHPGKPRDAPRSNLPKELWGIQPASSPFGLGAGYPPNTRFYGNEYFHVLELSPIAGGYRAYVCDGQYRIFHENESTNTFEPIYPSWVTDVADFNAVDVWRVEFTDHPSPPTPDAPPMVATDQKGPNPAPLGDVFGPWHISGADRAGFWGPSGSGSYDGWKQRKQLCRDRMPHTEAERHGIYSSKLDTPPATEPAVPGWPDNAL